MNWRSSCKRPNRGPLPKLPGKPGDPESLCRRNSSQARDTSPNISLINVPHPRHGGVFYWSKVIFRDLDRGCGSAPFPQQLLPLCNLGYSGGSCHISVDCQFLVPVPCRHLSTILDNLRSMSAICSCIWTLGESDLAAELPSGAGPVPGL